jgi:O-antigen ligase
MSKHPLFSRSDVCLPMLWIIGLPSFLLLAARTLPDLHIFKPDRVAFLIAIQPLIVLAWRRPNRLQRPGLVEAAMLMVLVVLVASWVTTIPGKPTLVIKQDADYLLSCFVMPFAAFVMARNADWTEERLPQDLWALIAALAIYFMVFGLIQSTVDWNFLVPASILQHPDRAKGPFDSAAPFGLLVVMLIVLTTLLFVVARQRSYRVAVVIMAIGLTQSLVASKTRAAWLALPAGLLIPFICYRKTRWLAAILVADLAVQVFLVPAIQVRVLGRPERTSASSPQAPPGERAAASHGDYLGLQERLVEEDPLYDRAAVTRIAVQMIRTHPLAGLGFGLWTFQSHKAEYYDALGMDATYAVYPNNAHNDVLNVLVQVGIVGAAAYGLLVYAIARLVWRRYRSSSSLLLRVLAVCTGALFIVLIVGAQFHSVMTMSYLQVLAYYFLGIVARDIPAANDSFTRWQHEAVVAS